jgi:hypothetical protein
MKKTLRTLAIVAVVLLNSTGCAAYMGLWQPMGDAMLLNQARHDCPDMTFETADDLRVCAERERNRRFNERKERTR